MALPLSKRLELYKLTKLSPQFWRSLGPLIKKWIWNDMQAGILQRGKDKYRDEIYIAYKKNNMRKFGRGASKVGAGERLKEYKGKPIRSTHTSSVNMLLTATLIKGLRAIKATIDSVTMSYAKSDEGKIIGNKKLGRDVTTLRDENIMKTKKEIETEMNKNIKNWASKKITIVIGK